MTPCDFMLTFVFERMTPASLANLHADLERLPGDEAPQVAKLVRDKLVALRGGREAQDLLARARTNT